MIELLEGIEWRQRKRRKEWFKALVSVRGLMDTLGEDDPRENANR